MGWLQLTALVAFVAWFVWIDYRLGKWSERMADATRTPEERELARLDKEPHGR